MNNELTKFFLGGEKTSLVNGNCIEVMNLIPDKSIDMILCDLPYGTTRCKWDNVIPFDILWTEYNRIIKERGAIVLFCKTNCLRLFPNSV